MKIRNLQIMIRTLGAILFISFLLGLTIVDVGFANYRVIEASPNKNIPQISTIFPVARTQIINNDWYVVDEPVYFTTRMPTKYDTVKVRLQYKNECCASVILGMQVGVGWDYQQELLHNNDFNNLSWDSYDFDGMTLWANKSVEFEIVDVLQSINDQTKVVSYNYNIAPEFGLEDYADSRVSINRPINIVGSYSLLVYIVDELNIDFIFSEIMLPFSISVYDMKGNKIFIDDIIDSHNNLSIINLREGVYKVTIAASSDIVTYSINSKHKYINFINQLSLVDGDYSLVTNATIIRWQVNNWSGIQTVQAGNQELSLRAINKKYHHRNLDKLTYLQIPSGNVTIFSDGLFSFDDNLLPYIPGKVSRIDDSSDFEYFIARYNQPVENNGWYIGEISFDLKQAVISRGTLRFMIGALGADIDNPLIIDSIEIIYEKKSDRQSVWSEFIKYLKYWWVYVR